MSRWVGVTSGAISRALGYTPANGTNYLPLAGGTMVGHLLFTDATYDIGASGATRPRNIYMSGALVIANGVVNIDGSTGIGTTKGVSAWATTAPAAGGTEGVGIFGSSTSNLGLMWGAGAPDKAAAKGTLYINTTATTTTTRLYQNTDGGTTWTNFTTAA